MRMLLATDGSASANDALAAITSSFDPGRVAAVEVLTVVRGDARDPAAASDVRERGQALVEAARARLAEAGFEATTAVRFGHPAEQIIDAAASSGVDLVVLGTRGLGALHLGLRRLEALQRAIAGSVSTKVARYAPVPVMVVDHGRPIARLVVGYDGSAAADAALDFTASLPLRTEPAITVCTAYEVPAPLWSGVAPTILAAAEQAYLEDVDEARKEAEQIAAAGIARLAERGRHGTARVVHGSPAAQLELVAAEVEADLIAVGDRGRSGIERFVLGSTSDALVAAPPTSVLVVRVRR